MKTIRYNPDPEKGLSDNQVQSRIQDNLINYDTSIPTKSIKKIIKDNLLTLFNLLNLILALALIFVGSYKNTVFIGVIVANVIIGTYQEIASKRAVDKLSIISSTKVKAIRNKKHQEIAIDQIVLDDIVQLSNGNQIVADCIIVSGECRVNESLITGESDSIIKKEGDILLSGSYIVSGNCTAKVEHIGIDNYASKISKDAKYVKKINSEIMSTFKTIILIISIIIIPIGIFLITKQLHVTENTLQSAVTNTVAALVGMIPEGLILLTSTVLAVSVIRLAKQKVLVQELYCIETLARVDVLCLDKTGTITEGTMEVIDTTLNDNYSYEDIDKALSSITSYLEDSNPTFNAIKEKFNSNYNYDLLKKIPFSSESKWSGVSFKEIGSYIMGAPEFILDSIQLENFQEKINKLSKKSRVLLIAHSKEILDNNRIPKNIEIIGFISLEDRIRSNAHSTLNFFDEQGVDIKIISGDNTLTVSNIAKRAGLKNANSYIDATTLNSYNDIKNAANKYSIFGRVTPVQKKQIVMALKESGHTVAMTGDGVNDVLALKEADCSIAMAAGSDAARNVSQLVLLNSDFESMVKVVDEGRRSINNIQRSSSLFIVKTIYSTFLAIIFLFINMQYPFMPIQMTLISVLTIGIPSFILALEPNRERIKGNFFSNILKKSIPGAFTTVLNIIILMTIKIIFNLTAPEFSTLAVLITSFNGLLLLYKISKPFNLIRQFLFATMILGLVISFTCFKNLFSLVTLTPNLLFILIFLIIISLIIFKFITYIFKYDFKITYKK